MELKIPKVRFRDFADTWEQHKLKDIVSFSKGRGYSKKDLKNSGTPILLYGDLYTNYETSITAPIKFTDLKRGSIVSKGNEVVIPASGETAEDIARASAIEKAGIILGGDLNILTPTQESNPYFLALSLSFGDCKSFLTQRAQGKTVVHLHNSDIKDLLITVPCFKEQSRISELFRSMGKNITLHQKKLEHFKKLKETLLQNMFPREGEIFPRLRFPEFTDAWEQRKFATCFEFLKNNTLSRANLTAQGPLRNIHYGDILIKFNELVDVKKDALPSVIEEIIPALGSIEYVLNGDVIFADTAEDSAVGKCIELQGISEERVISGLHTVPCRPSTSFAPSFLGFYLNSPAYRNQLTPLMQGIKVSSISKKALSSTLIQFPSDKEEQARIGTLFNALTHTITLHQKKLEQLKNLKTCLLNNLFVD